MGGKKKGFDSKIMTLQHTDIRVHREVTLPIIKMLLGKNNKSKFDNMQRYDSVN